MIIIAICLVFVVVTVILYSIFTSQYIYQESSTHLKEIYEQLNYRVEKQIEDGRSLLKSWDNYIGNTMEILNGEGDAKTKEDREKEFLDFMEVQQNEFKFTNFYFIGYSSEQQEEDDSHKDTTFKYEYSLMSPLTDSLETVHIRRPLRKLLDDDIGGVSGIIVDKNGVERPVILFAVKVDLRMDDTSTPEPINRYTYNGFQYVSIAISFNTQSMLDMLNVHVFGDKGEFYISLPDGFVLLQSGENKIDNFLDYINKEATIVRGHNIVDINNDWKWEQEAPRDQGSSTVLLRTQSEGEQYVTYMPIGFGGWMLVGVAPSDIVNSSMNWFRAITTIVMAVIFALMAASVAWIAIMRHRQSIKEKNLAIKSRENLLDLLTANTNDMFLLFSLDNRQVEYASTNIETVLGYDLNELKQDIRQLLKASHQTHPTFRSDTVKSLHIGQNLESDIQLTHITDDTEYWYHATLYHTSYNNNDCGILMLSDRTREKSLNATLQDALQLAKSANDAKSNFLSNMSHDIRTPMNAILGFATLLAKDADKPDKVREYIRKISFSGQHLLSLINDILDMSKIESGRTTLNKSEFGLSEMLEELYNIMLPQAKAKQQTFEMHTKGNMPERVIGDKMRLNQVVLNLLSNANKYTPVGGKIDLTIEALDKAVYGHAHLRIIVADNGLGMSEKFLQEIFEPFSREETVKTKNIQGTGLGMPIVKNIITLMGGTINVQSKLNEGSTFVIELELAIAEDKHEDDENFWQRHNVTHILVVDDEEDICRSIQELMEGTGVDIHYALGGKQAVKKVEKAFKEDNNYSIILLDWKMPDMNGIETAKRIRDIVGPDVSIMILTSYNFDEIEDEAKEVGINLFLPKPFFISNFRNAIEKLRVGDTADMENAPEKISIDGLKVLAAEDNEINAEILLELLELEGVTCEIASNGKEALEKFQKSKPDDYDMIFMDVQMPVMNGYEATKAIRACGHERAKDIPILAMTANAFDDDIKQAIDSGMNAHLSKPIDMDKLKEAVKKYWKK